MKKSNFTIAVGVVLGFVGFAALGRAVNWWYTAEMVAMVFLLIGYGGEIWMSHTETLHGHGSFKDKVFKSFLGIGVVMETVLLCHKIPEAIRMKKEIATLEREAVALKLEVQDARKMASAAEAKADKLSPLKQPIKTITGFLKLEIGPTVGSLRIGDNRTGFALGDVMIRLGPSRPEKSNAMDLVSKGNPSIWGNATNGWTVFFECGQHAILNRVYGPNPEMPVGEVLRNLKEFSVETHFLPGKTEIKGGQLKLTFNSSVTLNLAIPAHTAGDFDTMGQYFVIGNAPVDIGDAK